MNEYIGVNGKVDELPIHVQDLVQIEIPPTRGIYHGVVLKKDGKFIIRIEFSDVDLELCIIRQKLEGL